ncbi:hypothetical protein CAOG_00713 [Capsaspora owczarzaki ATCC 30864]|uniref:Uncharacterized protein n=1 Tax=Capsaspora owczarzaki (strain ATCC 30864) TaxID=595528 RepID=A0A0D2WJ20_CAPO3|nr:hypothetical protein CAOG_00713 [Capsaspora owczarzaki ATCC 30864]KJE89193.1 hypothetical protein CAOG_000713 [Capsaspora owczarzaki ATCC 30864]|eukprot:XP_004365584.1 hypothetical protein CAOG_00713 [Capsaspora owczarzaki ATCC 30864]
MVKCAAFGVAIVFAVAFAVLAAGFASPVWVARKINNDYSVGLISLCINDDCGRYDTLSDMQDATNDYVVAAAFLIGIAVIAVGFCVLISLVAIFSPRAIVACYPLATLAIILTVIGLLLVPAGLKDNAAILFTCVSPGDTYELPDTCEATTGLILTAVGLGLLLIAEMVLGCLDKKHIREDGMYA